MKKLAFLIIITASTSCYSQKMELRDYVFSVTVAKDQYIKDDKEALITASFTNIKLCPSDREIVISHPVGDDEVFKFKKRDKMSTYPNNYMFWCDEAGYTYKFTFVKISEYRYYLNLECQKNKTDIVFHLKEIK